MGWYCNSTRYAGLFGSLREAKYQCTMKSECVAINDYACDDIYYGLCLNSSNLVHNETRINGKKDCVHIRPGTIRFVQPHNCL